MASFEKQNSCDKKNYPKGRHIYEYHSDINESYVQITWKYH